MYTNRQLSKAHNIMSLRFAMKKFMIFSIMSTVLFLNLYSQIPESPIDPTNSEFLYEESVPPRIFPVERGSSSNLVPRNPIYQSSGYPENWYPPNPGDYDQNRYKDNGN